MADSEWGKCKDCKWFQIEPNAKAANNTMGLIPHQRRICSSSDFARLR